MSEEFLPPRRTWPRKFADAVLGIIVVAVGQCSFRAQLAAAIVVAVAAVVLRATATQGCLLALSVAVVLSAEAFNTALEHLAKAIDHRQNANLRAALDIASGAVLLAAAGAAVVGLIVFLPLLFTWMSGS